MKMPLPREPAQGRSGYYGGVGSKPAPRPWRPGSARVRDAAPPPRRFRRLRLRRTHRPHADDHALALPAPVIVAFVAIALYIVWVLMG